MGLHESLLGIFSKWLLIYVELHIVDEFLIKYLKKNPLRLRMHKFDLLPCLESLVRGTGGTNDDKDRGIHSLESHASIYTH